MNAGAGSKLTARGGVTIDRRGDLLELETEHIVQQEGGALSGDRRSSASISGKVTSSGCSSSSTIGSGSQGPR
jgi:hypothetical protein